MVAANHNDNPNDARRQAHAKFATGPVLTEVRPGLMVRLRAAPAGGPFPVIGVVREEHWGGAVTTKLRLGQVAFSQTSYHECFFVIDPAQVYADPSDNPTPATANAAPIEQSSAFDVKSVVEPLMPEGTVLPWEHIAANVIRTTDCRFEVELDAGGMYTARDAWTGEEVSKLATESAARQWCRCRLAGAYLTWSGWLARHACGDCYELRRGRPDEWFGIDQRFPAGHRLWQSPCFNSPELANRWCAIRGACTVEGSAPDTQTLRYEPPIPF